ncbi:MAG: DUF5985 family protein [Candidatus Sericytochromatia bacterium]
MMTQFNLFMLGAITMTLLMAGLFFLKFWRQTKDRLFLVFALSFFVEAINRAMLALSDNPREGEPVFYLVRLLSFALILIGILHKNLKQ